MRSFQSKKSLELDGLDQELLEDLGRQSLEAIQKLRTDVRVEVELEVSLLHGDSSRRGERAIQGHTKDLSPGGCLMVLEEPPAVGDIYRLHFKDTQLGLPSVFARCLRARLMREDAFEAGFQFFARLELPEQASEGAGSDILG